MALGCRPKPTEPAVYAPYEEGLTLVFEDPSQPTPAAREASRYTLRVEKGLVDPTKAGEILLSQSTLQGRYTYRLHAEAGGLALMGEDGKLVAWVLPVGFPDRVNAWSDAKRGITAHFLGRAVWDGEAIRTAAQQHLVDAAGLWVETLAPGDQRRRSLYLKGLGEVESQEWRKDHWETVNRLVGRRFTDLPTKNAG